ncbi:MAG: hypothetical protein B7Y35_06050 [Sphingomonadales bacterium 28-64-96]|nr:MAG: hypothetical protein B7Y35_06050 [Sphingomonadales bacterium 28-64-96]
MAETLTKSQFANLVQRNASQITRWVESGKLQGAALVGEGRTARINVAEALRQLNLSLDIGQQLAQAKPILPGQQLLGIDAPAASAQAPRGPAALPAGDVDPVEAERLERLQLDNARLRQQLERGAREDAVAAGQLVDIGAVRRALGRQVQPLATIFDQLPAAIAKPLAEQFGLPFNETLIAVRQAVRHQRHQLAETIEAIGQSVTA